MPTCKNLSGLKTILGILPGILLLTLLIIQPLRAQVPELIGYQGLLTGVDGNPLSDGTYSITFSLYEDAAGGSAIWTETQSAGVTNGVISAHLGQVESLASVPFDKPYWLGIAIDSGNELTPRVALASSPYALGSRTSGSSGGAFTLPFEGNVDATVGLSVTNESGVAVRGSTEGVGPAVQGLSSDVGIALYGASQGSGTAVIGVNEGTGVAGSFVVTNSESSANALSANTTGTGNASRFIHFGSEGSAGSFNNTNTNSTSPTVTIQSSTNTLAVPALYVEPSGRGTGGEFEVNETTNPAPALVGTHRGNGIAVQGNTNGTGFNAVGVWAQASNGSDGLPLRVTQNGAGDDVAVFQFANTNVARIDNLGTGFFNGGTQNSGADVAELFAVEGLPDQYHAGDVLSISTQSDRTVTRSQTPYSTLVSGVYATKPGVTLTERAVGESTDDLIPMGVIGVIPTKVSGENGPIARGDLLVTSSIPGHAMRGTDTSRMLGAVIGKALEPFDGSGTGMIKVLVNVK